MTALEIAKAHYAGKTVEEVAKAEGLRLVPEEDLKDVHGQGAVLLYPCMFVHGYSKAERLKAAAYLLAAWLKTKSPVIRLEEAKSKGAICRDCVDAGFFLAGQDPIACKAPAFPLYDFAAMPGKN